MHGTTSTTQKQEMNPFSKKFIEFDDVISTIGNLSSHSDQAIDSDFEIALKNNDVPLVCQMLQNDKHLLTTNDLFGNESLLSWVVAKGSAQMLNMLLLEYPECRDTPNANGLTPLMTAVITDNISLKLYRIEALLKAGVNVDARSSQGKTALMLAIEKLNMANPIMLPIIKLLKPRSNLRIGDGRRTSMGNTANMYAQNKLQRDGNHLSGKMKEVLQSFSTEYCPKKIQMT